MLIIIDGAVDLPETLEHSPDLRVVPGQVWLDDEAYAGSPGEFWALLRKGRYPSTTPPTIDALAKAYQSSEVVLGVHVSGELSTTIMRAREVADRATTEVAVIDTRSLSVGAGLVAAAAHRAAQDGSESGSIIDYARSLPERLHTFAVIQDVESLRRSDRSGLLPRSRLSLNRPILLAIRGRVVVLEQPKTRAVAINNLVGHVRHSVGRELGAWAMGHGDASDCGAVVDQLTRAFGIPPSFLASLDPTVGAHVGPDALVVAAFTGEITL